MRSTTGDTVRGSNGNDLCEINGTPTRQVSCTTDANAYSTARHVPVMAPTESGIEQWYDYAEGLIADRDADKLEDLQFSGCEGGREDWLALFADNDAAFGTGWFAGAESLEIRLPFVNRGEVDVVLRFFDRNGDLRSVREGLVSFTYENGAWREIENACL